MHIQITKVLIVDDHELYRAGLKDLLAGNADIIVAGEASNGQEALSMIAENDYGVVLLDITMPGIDGIEVLKRLKDSESEVKVLILSVQSEEHYLEKAFKVGAAGYLTKNRAPRELIAAIKTVSSGRKYLDPRLDKQIMARLEL